MTGDDDAPRPPASPPCFAHEVDPAYFGIHAGDPWQQADVARWRSAERKRLRAARREIAVADRPAIDAAIARHLEALIARRFGDVRDRTFSVYWPIKGEPDLRGWMRDLHARGAVVALPLVETPAAPLAFRRWTPETRMRRGHWNIPVPPPDAPEVVPEIALAPLVGWDGEGYRLGYGGGYFDRTLAALRPRPLTIGIGLQSARLATIYPQPHDIALDAIVTEAGVQLEHGP